MLRSGPDIVPPLQSGGVLLEAWELLGESQTERRDSRAKDVGVPPGWARCANETAKLPGRGWEEILTCLSLCQTSGGVMPVWGHMLHAFFNL